MKDHRAIYTHLNTDQKFLGLNFFATDANLPFGTTDKRFYNKIIITNATY